MNELSGFCRKWLRTNPEQVQIFSPTLSTISTLMYCTGKDMEGNPVWSEHFTALKQKQKDIVVRPERKSRINTNLSASGTITTAKVNRDAGTERMSSNYKKNIRTTEN